MKRRRPPRPRAGDQHGASAVEFAIVVPVFLVAVLGIFYGCLALFSYNALQNSLEIGARELLFEGGTQETTETAIRAAAATTLLRDRDLAVDFTEETSPVPYTEIVVTYDLRLLSGIGLRRDLTLSATTVVATTAP